MKSLCFRLVVDIAGISDDISRLRFRWGLWASGDHTSIQSPRVTRRDETPGLDILPYTGTNCFLDNFTYHCHAAEICILLFKKKKANKKNLYIIPLMIAGKSSYFSWTSNSYCICTTICIHSSADIAGLSFVRGYRFWTVIIIIIFELLLQVNGT